MGFDNCPCLCITQEYADLLRTTGMVTLRKRSRFRSSNGAIMMLWSDQDTGESGHTDSPRPAPIVTVTPPGAAL
jgi:hypothetical protein